MYIFKRVLLEHKKRKQAPDLMPIGTGLSTPDELVLLTIRKTGCAAQMSSLRFCY
jgi:hypothetical protein